jgi:2,4-dienoyl-CoA reductase-like NADH-dependent reductase (Old Yellow Enzyme family)
MSILFEKSRINGMELNNRFVRSATWEGMAGEDGACTPRVTKVMTELAEREVGLIISSHAYVLRDGQAGPLQLGIYKDDLIDDYRKMTRAVHAFDAKVVLQIAHAGAFASGKLIKELPLAFSSVENFTRSPRRILKEEEMGGLVEAFAQGARRAKEAGFDGVQIHAAHGYLLSQSLSPALNRRNDQYGGPLENRARLLMEVLEAVRGVVGGDFPLLVKLNSEDFLEGGLTLDESVRVGEMLEKGGIDAIELSGGTFFSGKLNPSRMGIATEEKEAYFRKAAKAYKQKVQVPLILVGGNRSFRVAEKLVQEGYAEYISMSRPFIREPGLIKRWASGDLRKARCLSDNLCFEPGMKGKGIYCVVEKRLKEKQQPAT